MVGHYGVCCRSRPLPWRGSAIAGGFGYTIALQVRETSGAAAVTVQSALFTFFDGATRLGSSTLDFNVFTSGPMIAAGTTANTGPLAFTDTRPDARYATRVTVAVDYTSGATTATATGTADVPPLGAAGN